MVEFMCSIGLQIIQSVTFSNNAAFLCSLWPESHAFLFLGTIEVQLFASIHVRRRGGHGMSSCLMVGNGVLSQML